MKHKIIFIITIFVFGALNAQTTFDWDSATAPTTDNGDNVTQTINGITTTFTISGFNSVGVINGAGLDGSSGDVISSSSDSSQPSTPSTNIIFSFSEAVDIQSIITLVGPANTLTFTPNGGSNSTVSESAFSGGLVNLNWTNVNSFVVTGTNAQYVIGFDDLIVSSATLSTNKASTESIQFYPNPVSDFLYLRNLKHLKSSKIYNCLGQLVTQTKKDIIDFRNFKPGAYILQIKTDTGIINKKIIKN